MTTLEILLNARALIENEENWTGGVLCDAYGRYCALGAVAKVVLGLPDEQLDPHRTEDSNVVYDAMLHLPVIAALARAAEFPRQPWHDDLDVVYKVNDRGHHETVLALFDRAIAVEEAKAQEFTAAPAEEPCCA